MVDGGRHLRLAQEPGAGLGIVAELGRDDLERHLAPQAGLLGEVHDTHPAAADDGLDAIRTELGAEAGIGTWCGHGWMNRLRSVELRVDRGCLPALVDGLDEDPVGVIGPPQDRVAGRRLGAAHGR